MCLNYRTTKYEAKRPSGCWDYRVGNFSITFFSVTRKYEDSMRIYIGILLIIGHFRSVSEPILAKFWNFHRGGRQLYNLGNYWPVWIHIWRLRALGMYFKSCVADFALKASFSRKWGRKIQMPSWHRGVNFRSENPRVYTAIRWISERFWWKLAFGFCSSVFSKTKHFLQNPLHNF